MSLRPLGSTGGAHRWLLAAAVAIGAVLRFAGLGSRSLWVDESFSIWLARQPLAQAWTTTVALDMHPPLYYTLLHGWLVLGTGEGAARSLSALLSVLTIPLAYLIGEQVGGRWLGLVTAGLLALSPLQVYYAQQTRMYAMLTFFAAASLLSLLRLLDAQPQASATRRPGPWWICFVLSTTLAVLSHNSAVLLPIAIAIFLAVSAAPTMRQAHPAGDLNPFVGLPGIASGLATALLLWLPWLPGFLSQTRRIDAEFWLPAPTADAVLQHWKNLALAYGPDGPWVVPIVAVVMALAVVGAWGLRHTPTVVHLIVMLVLAPVAAELIISLRRPIFYTQTLVWTAVPLCVLLAAGLLALRPRVLAGVAGAVILTAHIAALVTYARDPGLEDWRAAAGYVADRVEPGDLLLFNAGWTEIPFDYYWDRHDRPAVEQHGLPADMLERGILEPKMTSADLPRLDSLVAGRPRVWLLYSHDWYTDPADLIPPRLADAYGAGELREFPGVRVYLFVAPPA